MHMSVIEILPHLKTSINFLDCSMKLNVKLNVSMYTRIYKNAPLFFVGIFGFCNALERSSGRARGKLFLFIYFFFMIKREDLGVLVKEDRVNKKT